MDGFSPAAIRLHSLWDEAITTLETFLSAHLPDWEKYLVVDWFLKHLDQGTTPAGIRFERVKLTTELSSYVLTVSLARARHRHGMSFSSSSILSSRFSSSYSSTILSLILNGSTSQ